MSTWGQLNKMVPTMLVKVNKEVLLTLELERKLLSGDLSNCTLFRLSDLVAFHMGFSRSIIK